MKKTIYWLLQSNQLTPTIIDFFDTLKTRLTGSVDLEFLLPDTSNDAADKIKQLSPLVVTSVTRTATGSSQVYNLKKTALKHAAFTDGLKLEDTLLLDDFGGGNTQQTQLEIPAGDHVAGLILQIPTPLGSSDAEERMFQAAVFWAAQHQVPSIGYELLPLDTRWLLATAMPDGVITRSMLSYTHLKAQLTHRNIFLLPNFEASIFTPLSGSFQLNGVKAAYHYRNHNRIPANRTILYLPHNVAMTYEYHQLLDALSPLGRHLHLMIGISRDQSRGSYSQQETIEIVYRATLEKFASHAFHNLNSPWEMMAADAVVACSACFNTLVAQNQMDCIVFDPRLPAATDGKYIRISSPQALTRQMEQTVMAHTQKRELADILIMLGNRLEE